MEAPLCANVDGFSLHAGVRVAAGDRRRLEHLLRYAGRPAIAGSRLSLLADRVAYQLKRRWRDGTTHVVMSPEVLIERLLALVPRPRRHLVTYHGVLAPAAVLRSRIVPRPPEDVVAEGELLEEAVDASEPTAILVLRRRRRSVPQAPGSRRRLARRYPWADLLRRVFEVEVLVCPHCGGKRRLLAAITAPDSIERVLRALKILSRGENQLGNLDRAAEFCRERLTQLRDSNGDHPETISALLDLAGLHAASAPEFATRHYRDAVATADRLARPDRTEFFELECRKRFARHLANGERRDEAQQVLAEIASRLASYKGSDRQEYASFVAELRDRLGSAR